MVICYVAADAQTVGVAVLSHNNESTMFYGNTALQQAVDAATEGDVITLSPGTFDGLNQFSKSGLTIIGSGMDEGPSQTILKDFMMRANDNEEKFIKIILKNLYIWYTGQYRNGNYELYFDKCHFNSDLDCYTGDDETKVIEMNNCIVGRCNFTNCNLKAYNCTFHKGYDPFISHLNLEGNSSRERILTNCVLFGAPTDKSSGSIHNCIIIDNEWNVLSNSLRATNCKAIVANEGYFGTQTFTNERLPYDFQAFVEGSFYELLPELAGTWVDEHGSQIGIYGGPKPFSVLPDAPRFTKFDVPAKTDADGHLKVEIEVAMPEK